MLSHVPSAPCPMLISVTHRLISISLALLQISTCIYASFQREVKSGSGPMCVHCRLSFHSQEHLSLHMRAFHAGPPGEANRRYPCLWVGCGMRFKTMANLRQHMPRHTGEKPFSCPECTYKSNRKSSVMGHIQAMHKDIAKTFCADTLQSDIQ